MEIAEFINGEKFETKFQELTNPANFERLQCHVLASETRQSFVPDGSQQLLNIRVRHKLR